MAELCLLFKIKSDPLHPLSGALPLSYVSAHVPRGALVAHSVGILKFYLIIIQNDLHHKS